MKKIFYIVPLFIILSFVVSKSAFGQEMDMSTHTTNPELKHEQVALYTLYIIDFLSVAIGCISGFFIISVFAWFWIGLIYNFLHMIDDMIIHQTLMFVGMLIFVWSSRKFFKISN